MMGYYSSHTGINDGALFLPLTPMMVHHHWYQWEE
ncbi:unnamed protein product [Staurois parvus]|uniref:Uncharacterized protein n=1 Tax=Staurois parvus TaxID=386267 RepID=A0ABN9EEI4_9NEOB|nr:unnamed protein product [Staurois parvus]